MISRCGRCHAARARPQVLYGFARFNFHPGAVVGRVTVVFQRHPDFFTAKSHHLLNYALPALEGRNPSVSLLGSRPDTPMSEE